MMLTRDCLYKKIYQLLLVFIVCFCNDIKALKAEISHIPTTVHQVIQKTLSRESAIDRVPVESDIYLQRIIASYNAHIKYAILAWFKKEILSADSFSKEISYLLSQLDSLTMPKQAIVILARALSAHSSMMQDSAYQESRSWLERAYCAIVLQSSVVLVNGARQQLLMILDEVHDSLLYWKEQKERPIKYFFHKPPLKWVKGKRQADEVASNIKKLEKLEHDIRVVLGRLTKHIYTFDLEGDVSASYSWIEKLLAILSCVGISQGEQVYSSTFDEVAEKLRFKLGRVSHLKDTILSKITSGIKPGHLARNWVMYTLTALAAYQARNLYLANTEAVHETLKRSAENVGGLWKSTTDPVKDAWKTIFGASSASPEGEDLLAKNAAEIGQVVPGLKAGEKTLISAMGSGGLGLRDRTIKELENLLQSGQHTWSGMLYMGGWGQNIIDDVKAGNLKSLEEAVANTNWTNPGLLFKLEKILLILQYIQPVGGIITDVAQILPPIASSTQVFIQFLSKSIKSNELTMRLLTLIPAFGIGLGLNKMYGWVTAKDYSSIRLALLDINSLFIESTAPLSDHNYGKLIYLLQGLKLQAMRYLTRADMLSDFLTDLAKLESDKFNVETKRNIINNMFMKYSFLQLSEKST